MNINSQNPECLNIINKALEEKSWFAMEDFFPKDFCDTLFESYYAKTQTEEFKAASIGQGLRRSENTNIRSSEIHWINNWDESNASRELKRFFDEMLASLNHYFYLSIKHYESQVAYYGKGDFYKVHLDQFQKTKHRQVSCCLYLNDCINGGEFVLYKKGSKTLVEHIIKPKRGSFVIFLSGHIYHEVKMVYEPRYSLTTWFRDDDEALIF